MRKIFLVAAAALLVLLPAVPSPASTIGPFDPAGREEYRFHWGEGLFSRYQDYYSGGQSDRGVWRNQAYLFGEYGGYDWSLALRVGAATFSSKDDEEWSPVAYGGATVKALVWSSPDSPWLVGTTLSLDQSLPFETDGDRSVRISGLYNANLALGVQKREDDRHIFYGGPFYALSGFKFKARYMNPSDNASLPPTRPRTLYYKLDDRVGLHGGVAWTLPGVDLVAEGQATLEGFSAGVSFRVPLKGEPESLVPRSIRELFGGWGDRPRTEEEQEGLFGKPERDDGPPETLGTGGGGR